MERIDDLSRDAKAIRKWILEALFDSGGGHYGGSMSVTDILLVLYREIVCSSVLFRTEARERVILSKGHAAIALYSVLKHVGILQCADLRSYGAFGSRLEGHPDMETTEGVEFSTGSLGQGISAGLGMALAQRGRSHVWVVVGDGECQEGQVWETAMIATRYSVNNLHVIIDNNGGQESGWSYNVDLEQRPIVDIESKWQAFGWATMTVDGHNHNSLLRAYEWARTTESPSVVVANTLKGKGLPSAERDPVRFHCTVLTEKEHRQLLEELDASEPRP